MTTASVPHTLKVNKERNVLTLIFEDEAEMKLDSEYMRVESPSAEVQGHGPGQKKTVAGKKNVTITDVQPVGHYAIRIVFSDGHDTGLFTWDYLKQLGTERAQRWEAYLAALALKKLSRGEQ